MSKEERKQYSSLYSMLPKDVENAKKEYSPSEGVGELKQAFALASLAAPAPLNYLANIGGATGDFYTGTRYLADGQVDNALSDYGQGIISLFPYIKGMQGLKGLSLTSKQKKINRAIKSAKNAEDTYSITNPK